MVTTPATATLVRRSRYIDVLPTLALAFLIIGWIGLAPWRPILSGDDWGYYDSVILTITHGRPIVSDWLAPATVGLTLPAAGMVLLIGDLWIGCIAVLGIFGLLGLCAIWSLLRTLAIPSARIALTLVVLGYFPIYMEKWNRFESSLPAASLLLAALALLLSVFLSAHGDKRSLLLSLGAGICIAWAIAIRQNHIIALPVGMLGIVLAPALRQQPRGQRVLLLGAWTLPSLITIVALRLGVPTSFAQRTATLDQVGAHFSVVGYLAALLRALSFSSGIAMLLALLIAPRTVVAAVRQTTRVGWIIGLASASSLLAYSAQQPTWLIPQTDILALVLVRQTVLLLAVILGSLFWWTLFTNALRMPRAWLSGGLLMLAAGYLSLVAAWGYWEYYLLEPILLLVIVQLLSPATSIRPNERIKVSGNHPRSARFARLAWLAVILIYVGLCWNIQRMSDDVQATEIQILEHAFRDGIAVPANTDQVPFGLRGWSLFAHQVTRWTMTKQGFSLAFWELVSPDPAIRFQWGCADASPKQEADRTLRSGTAQVGWQQQCWSLIQNGGHVPMTYPITDHRYLPLTSTEWREMISRKASS